MVDRFVALTEFSKRVFERGGLSGSRIAVRPNFLIDDPGVGIEPRSGAVYVGRLSPEKGIECLLEAWRSLSDIPLTIIGDGPMRKWAVGFVQKHSMDQVRMAGAVSLEDVLSVLKRSSLLVFPSVWYETFGRTIIEAYSAGTPVLASDIGAGGSLVEENVTGLHFDPGNPDDLAAKVREMALDADRLRQWGANAREEYLAKYSASSAYESLMRIYERVVL
jgi:glycosyltransferase involved in cell wall biosynthesis